MEATRPLTDRIKLPAWLGSIALHLLILLIVLLMLCLRPEPPSAPGDRNATGGIVLKQESQDGKSYVDSDNNEYGEASPRIADDPLKAPTLRQTLAGDVSDLHDLTALLPDPAIGPRAVANSGANVVGGADLARDLQGGSRVAGLGFETGGKATVKVFGLEGKGNSFVYVFDRSGSMNENGGKPMRAAKEQLIQGLEPLGTFHRFNIIFYNDQPLAFQAGRKMVGATDVQKESARKFVQGVIPMGGTRHFEPLRDAIRHRPDVIFFLTDGDENDALSPGQLQELTRLNNAIGGGAQINVIQFGSGNHRQAEFLRKLAAQNRGQYTYFNVADWR